LIRAKVSYLSLEYVLYQLTIDRTGLHELFKTADPFFDDSRFVMKVAATWEGLQACRELRNLGIKTLGTTLFSMEQAVLAGEAGCVSISPFVRELKEMVDPR
jgi:transaldolase